MNVSNQGYSRSNGLPERDDTERDFSLVQAVSLHHRQASQARKLRAIYSQSPAQYFMTFQQFQKPAKRNRILVENGREKIFTPFDPLPKKRGKLERQPVTQH